MAVPKTGVFRRKSGNRQTIQEFCFAEFLSFCAFAEKNAVSLANQGCKGSQSVLLCRADEAEAVVVVPVVGVVVVPVRDGTV